LLERYIQHHHGVGNKIPSETGVCIAFKGQVLQGQTTMQEAGLEDEDVLVVIFDGKQRERARQKVRAEESGWPV